MRAMLFAGAAVAALGAVAPAWAQTEPESQPSVVGEIVVTAQKREERLQDVPVAISVVPGEILDAQGGVNIENAQYLIPTLNFRKSGTSLNQSLFLRGVGTINFSIAAEPSVATVLDGVVLSRAGEAFGDLVDIERLEVLRGPQGTLFGKNASAGVVNVVSRRPGKDFGGYLEGSYFEGEEYRIKGAVDVPLSDTTQVRLTGFVGEYDGNIYNATTREDVNGYKRWGVRGVLVSQVNERLTFTATADYRESDDDCCAEVIGTTPTGLGALALPASSFRRDDSRTVYQNLVTATKEESGGFSFQADYDLGAAGVLTSITAYRVWDNEEIRDGDWLPQAYVGLNQLHDVGPQESDTFSQELRLASPTDGRFDYVLGLYYSRAEADRTFTRSDVVCNTTPAPTTLIPCGSAGAPASTFPFGTATFGSVFENAAAFGQVNLDVTDRFRLLGGLRYTVDDLEVYHSRFTSLAGPGIQPSFPVPASGVLPTALFEASTDETNFSGRVGAQFDLSDDVMAYATYVRGYKGPAYNVFFNLTATGTNVIEAETVDSYEVGLKTTLLDGRVVLNAAAFTAKYDNYQANNPDIVAGVLVTRLTNAGEVSTKGVEFDLLAEPIDNLVITGGVAYTDAQVESFRAPLGAAVIPSGTPLANAPEWKAAVSADYRIVTGGFADIGLTGSLAYQSEQLSQFDASAAIRQATTIDGYTLVDASVSLIDPNDGWKLTALVRNLTDESFAASITSGGPGGSYRYIIPREADRYFGLIARVNY
jgi:iron complex outermembrane recepter protein